jgi:predicted site-specific integrase-resolvase
MKVEELLAKSKCNLSEVARVLNITAPAAYKWLKTGEVPPLRVYELREKKPEWFEEKVGD